MSEKVSSIGLISFTTAQRAMLFQDEDDMPEVSWNLIVKSEIKKWLDQNNIVDYTVDADFFYFENETDAVAFKLRWL